DIDKYFKLDQVNPTAWKPAANPNSAPFELSTGASDAVAYHDYYRLQIAFEDVWAELIDDSIGTTAQAFYAKWDELMNEGQRNDLANEQYTSQLEAASTTVGVSKSLAAALASQIAAGNGQGPLTQLFYNQALGQIQTSIAVITQIQSAASDLFNSSFGLELQSIQAELQLAVSKLRAVLSGQAGAGASVASALDAAFQLIAVLKSKLSQGAAARIAAFNAMPPDDIGGIDQLENFLNDVRIILDLPTVATPFVSST